MDIQSDRVGEVLGGVWRLDAVLGRGGSATVYAAEHVETHQTVAVKLIDTAISVDSSIRARLARERSAANSVDHPGVVKILDCSTEGHDVYLVLERLEGESLKRRWRDGGQRLPVDEVGRVLTAVLDILAAAHHAGVVHRDVKPDNVFLTAKGAVKLLDFGIAWMKSEASLGLTREGVVLGTPAFMPPEQAMGNRAEVDAQSDVYAVGAVAWTLLTGRLVHTATTVPELIVAASTRNAEPIRTALPDLDPDLAAVIDKALKRDKSARWQSAEAMKAAWDAARASGAPGTLQGKDAKISVLPAPDKKTWALLETKTVVSAAAPTTLALAKTHRAPLGRTIAKGDTIGGRYVVEGILGEGGMAIVYAARHTATERLCAVKVIHPRLITRPELVDQFVKEARVGSSIGQNPHIVDVFDAGADEERGVPFLAMELLAGETLEQYVEARGPLTPAMVRLVSEQMADALDQAHAAGVVHRDLKPSNLFLTRGRKGEPVVKVVDFGIAKAIKSDDGRRTATQIGSPAYAAPEQFGSGFRDLAERLGIVIAPSVSRQTDVWAMGLIAYELFTGDTASEYWGVETLAELPLKVSIGEQDAPTMRAGQKAHLLPPGFDAWFARCTRRNAADRFPSAGEAAKELAACISEMKTRDGDGLDEGTPSLPPSLARTLLSNTSPEPPRRAPPIVGVAPVRSTKRIVLAAALAFVAGVGGTMGLGLVVQRHPSAAAGATSSAVNDPPPAPAPADCPEDMAALPGGSYTMGERHDHVTVGGFCLDRTEVTIAAYEACVKVGQCTDSAIKPEWVTSYPNFPVSYVTWDQATMYCRIHGKRLPTEEEWEWAARGGAEGRTYPWGDGAPEDQLCWSGTIPRVNPCAVGQFPKGDAPGGIHDMAGNVWEWTASNWDDTTAARVCRGGCFDDKDPAGIRGRVRSRSQPGSRNKDLGFRCAR